MIKKIRRNNFKLYFEFADYLPQELSVIAQYACKEKGVRLTHSATTRIDEIIIEAYRNRDRAFGNARFVYDLIDQAKIALGLGMKVIASDPLSEGASIGLEFFNGQNVNIYIETTDFQTVLKESDFITVHAPTQDSYLLGKSEIEKMKTGVGIINAAHGGLIDEVALINAIEDKKVKFAGLDVYENEPRPEIQLLMNPELSLTPHIGEATMEAQSRIGIELADQIIRLLGN